jgi:hypothetical protein
MNGIMYEMFDRKFRARSLKVTIQSPLPNSDQRIRPRLPIKRSIVRVLLLRTNTLAERAGRFEGRDIRTCQSSRGRLQRTRCTEGGCRASTSSTEGRRTSESSRSVSGREVDHGVPERVRNPSRLRSESSTHSSKSSRVSTRIPISRRGHVPVACCHLLYRAESPKTASKLGAERFLGTELGGVASSGSER